jgi:hypothetical protein
MSTQKNAAIPRAPTAPNPTDPSPPRDAHFRVSRLTHGLTSTQLVIDGETEFKPQTRSQFDLVDQLVATRWRLNRVIALQQPEIDGEFESCGGDIPAAIAYQHLCDDSCALHSRHRHEARLSAELRRTSKLRAAELKESKIA